MYFFINASLFSNGYNYNFEVEMSKIFTYYNCDVIWKYLWFLSFKIQNIINILLIKSKILLILFWFIAYS